MTREKTRILILLSSTVEEADAIVIRESGYTNTSNKIAYLRGMFDVNLIGRADDDSTSENDSIEMDYFALLSTIINSKWEA